jgi:hypothetical protein
MYIGYLIGKGLEYVLKNKFSKVNVVGYAHTPDIGIYYTKYYKPNNILYLSDIVGLLGKRIVWDFFYYIDVNDKRITCIEGKYFSDALNYKRGFIFIIPVSVFKNSSDYGNFAKYDNSASVEIVNQNNDNVYLFLSYEFKLETNIFKSVDNYLIKQIIIHSEFVINNLLSFVVV